MNNITNITGRIPDGTYAITIKNAVSSVTEADIANLKKGETLKATCTMTFLVEELDREFTETCDAFTVAKMPDGQILTMNVEGTYYRSITTVLSYHNAGKFNGAMLIGSRFGGEILDGNIVGFSPDPNERDYSVPIDTIIDRMMSEVMEETGLSSKEVMQNLIEAGYCDD